MDQPYIGKTCPYCQFTLKQDSEAVICRDCKIPHHKECWHENGGCTTFGCKAVISGGSGSRATLDTALEERAGEKITLPITKKTGKIFAAVITIICGVGMLLIVNAFLSLQPPVNIGRAVDPSVIAALDADYYIDFDNGTIPIGDLPIGAQVFDPSWEWEFRTGGNYTGKGDVKPVIWIVVAKNHYEGLSPHVTLLSEELIGKYPFDDSTDRDSDYGSNHWGESGTTNATHGLRPWLNSSGIHEDEGFYRAFSESFKQVVLNTTLPNKEWENGTAYSTRDKVFIPSTTELGEIDHEWTFEIGINYSYFRHANDSKRIALLGGMKPWYWTRSPNPSWLGSALRGIHHDGGNFYSRDCAEHTDVNVIGVRPALNLKSEILVSEIP